MNQSQVNPQINYLEKMSRLSELDQALHYFFVDKIPHRDFSLVSRAIQLKGKWMHDKKIILLSNSDKLWYWK